MRVLLVAGDRALAEEVRRGLVDAGLAVDLAADGADALAKLATVAYPVVLLDRDLPGDSTIPVNSEELIHSDPRLSDVKLSNGKLPEDAAADSRAADSPVAGQRPRARSAGDLLSGDPLSGDRLSDGPLSGDEVCRRIAQSSHPARVLMFATAGSVTDRVAGLELGADDYLVRPFAMAELVARIRVLGRRVEHAAPRILRWSDLELDPIRHVARRRGAVLRLTRKEFGVLEVLMRAQGAPVGAEELLEQVWDENTDPFTNAVRITMMTLRRKLGEPRPIETVTGIGYRLINTDARPTP